MNDVTQLLDAIDDGDAQASEKLLPLVYEELRRLAAQRLAKEPVGQTLQATALVHDAFVRLVDAERQQKWNSRGHFFGAAAEAMRRILIGISRHVEYLLRNIVFGHLLALPSSFFQSMRTGDIMSRSTADVEAVRLMLGPGVMYVSQAIVIVTCRSKLQYCLSNWQASRFARCLHRES